MVVRNLYCVNDPIVPWRGPVLSECFSSLVHILFMEKGQRHKYVFIVNYFVQIYWIGCIKRGFL